MNYDKIRKYADLVVLVIGTVLLSYLFFKEQLTKKKIAGIACILVGIFVYYL